MSNILDIYRLRYLSFSLFTSSQALYTLFTSKGKCSSDKSATRFLFAKSVIYFATCLSSEQT